MMSVLEYAEDVGKTVEEITKLCSKLGISITDENTNLNEDEIVLLDGEIANGMDDSEEKTSSEEDYEESLDEKVEEIVANSKIDVENTTNKQKLKSKSERIESSKVKFQKDKKEMYKHKEKLASNEEEDNNVVLYDDEMTVSTLANSLKITPVDVIKKLMKLGIMANINKSLSFEEAELVCLDYDKELKRAETKDVSNFEKFEINEKEENLVYRPPIVTVMGHVDHGKTSLLDYIREANVVSGEAGGITQAIGAYQVDVNGKKVTFIDTPGHEAFTEMRARGASVTDIVIIIVAADDGVKPQTKEAIDHAKAAKVPIIVAVNKIDKPEANIDRVKKELAEYGLNPEDWGGDTIFNYISCKTGEGIDKLLDNIILVSEMGELKANPNRYAIGTVLESRLDKKIGVVATVIVQNGTLRLGDPIVIGTSAGKVRSLKNDKGEEVVEALPSTPVEITGIPDIPSAGDKFMSFETEKQAKNIAEIRKRRVRAKDTNKNGMTLDDLFGAIKEGVKEINVVLKTDVNGSLEAIKILLAHASNAIIIGFNVRPSNSIMDSAKEYNVDIKLYDIIYKMIEDIENAMKGMLDPVYEEVVTGTIEVRKIFKFSKVGNIAGSHVTSGKVVVGSSARLIRDGIVIANTKIKSLQREKDSVKEVVKDMDCGITLENYQDIRENDIIEVYELKEVAR